MYPFTPRAAPDAFVQCSTDDDCGHGFLVNMYLRLQLGDARFGASVYVPTILENNCFIASDFSRCIWRWDCGIALNVALALYWSFFAGFVFANVGVIVFSDNNRNAGKTVFLGCVSCLCLIGLAATYIISIVFIAGDECMDSNGIACGS